MQIAPDEDDIPEVVSRRARVGLLTVLQTLSSFTGAEFESSRQRNALDTLDSTVNEKLNRPTPTTTQQQQQQQQHDQVQRLHHKHSVWTRTRFLQHHSCCVLQGRDRPPPPAHEPSVPLTRTAPVEEPWLEDKAFVVVFSLSDAESCNKRIFHHSPMNGIKVSQYSIDDD